MRDTHRILVRKSQKNPLRICGLRRKYNIKIILQKNGQKLISNIMEVTPKRNYKTSHKHDTSYCTTCS